MPAPAVAHARIKKINAAETVQADDLLAAEEPLEIRIGYGPQDDRKQKSISVTMRTPGHDFELALGFLHNEGMIRYRDDIAQIRYCTEANTIENKENIVRVELKAHVDPELDKLERHFYTTSSCGVCGKASIEAIQTVCTLAPETTPLRVAKDVILALPQQLRAQQNVFAYTGGLHASALFDADGNMVLLREDVGRHNALDKLTGAALGAGMLPLEKYVLLLSGRASFELIQKAAMSGIRLVAAVGAPSSLAVQAAREFGITLVGFLRESRFNIYSFEERILL